MVIDSPSVVVRQVVTKAEGGRASGTSVTVRFMLSEEVSVPSLTVSVRVRVVLASTCGAVNVVDSAVRLVRAMSRVAGSWDQPYVRAPPSSSEAVPDRVTVWPSATVWSAPASTEGGALRWTMVISTRSEAVALCWSVAVRARVRVVLAGTSGAVKVVSSELGSAKEMGSVK